MDTNNKGLPDAGYQPRVALIMRSYNDRAVIRATLESVMGQSYRHFELWNFDSSSSDGTLDIIREFNQPERIRLNDSRSYNPGRVLNQAVSETSGEVLVFLNSDATPERPDWLQRIIEPLADPRVGAVYGRQTPRPDCRPLFVKDTERAFGDGRVAAAWVHFFSMANAAARREILQGFPFETRIQYSEDIEWSYRLRQAGYLIRYVAEAPATHSHNYSLRQSYKRHFGEGQAEAWIFRRGELKTSFWRYGLLPFGMEVLRDWRWGLQQGSLEALWHSLPLRGVQKWARWQGLREGQRTYVDH